MPFGWFKVALPDDIPTGTIVTRRLFGTDVVLWRDGQGQVVCQEAYCAHLGAHLGVGVGPLGRTPRSLPGGGR